MIWFLALLLLASVAALGYRQGAIKVACSTIGILIGAMLAVPLGGLLKPLLGILGMKNPLMQYLLAPVIVFFVISILFKVAAAQIHHKIDVYYKYRAGDLRLALWERLNHRLGGCLGLLNGAIYLVLLSIYAFSLSYGTYQLASSDEDPRWMRLLNSIGKGMQNTGFHKVARALDGRTQWYQAADLAGVIFQNSLTEARLSRYPALLGLSERGEFKDLGSDKEFSELRLARKPFMEIWNHSKVVAIRENPDLARTIWTTVAPDLTDLRQYLDTGVSSKYDKQPILGRWTLDPNQTLLNMRRAKPRMTSREAAHLKRWLTTAFGSTSMVAMTDNNVLLKNLPQVRVPPPLPADPSAVAPIPSGTQNVNGQWKTVAGGYELTLGGGGIDAAVDGDRLKMTYDGMEMAFLKEI